MLKPDYPESHPDEKIKHLQENHRKEILLLKFLEKTMPKNFDFSYSMSCASETIWLHLYPFGHYELSENETRALMVWSIQNIKESEKPAITLNEEVCVYYTSGGKIFLDKETEVFIHLFINHAHKLSCQIKPVVKEVTVYEIVCDDE